MKMMWRIASFSFLPPSLYITNYTCDDVWIPTLFIQQGKFRLDLIRALACKKKTRSTEHSMRIIFAKRLYAYANLFIFL